MDSAAQTRILTAATIKELDPLVKGLETDLVEQGWHTEGSVITNADGTVSQKMVRKDPRDL